MVAVAYYTLAPQPSQNQTTQTTYNYTANIPCTFIRLHSSVESNPPPSGEILTTGPQQINLSATVNGVFCSTFEIQFDNYTSYKPSNLTVIVPESFQPFKLPSDFRVLINGSSVRLSYLGTISNPLQFNLLLSPTVVGTYDITVSGRNIPEILVSVNVASD